MPGRRAAPDSEATQIPVLLRRVKPNGRGLGAWGPLELRGIQNHQCPTSPATGVRRQVEKSAARSIDRQIRDPDLRVPQAPWAWSRTRRV
jgi:hypothetical protein